MSDVPRIVADMPVRFFKKDLAGFTLEGKKILSRKPSRKVYELSIPKALDQAQGGQSPLNACLLILRGLRCEGKGGAQLKFERVLDENGRLADEKVKDEDKNLPSSCSPCSLHRGETCHPYHDYDKDSGVKAGQVWYLVLSNQRRSEMSVESVAFVCALIANSDEGRRIRYENVRFPPVPPREADISERIGFTIEETTDGYKAWGALLPRNGQAKLPWNVDIELDSEGHRPSDVAFLYLYNVRTPRTQHGYIRCTMGEQLVGEQYAGPDCNSPLIFDFSHVSPRVFDRRINLGLESRDTDVVVRGNIELFFVTV